MMTFTHTKPPAEHQTLNLQTLLAAVAALPSEPFADWMNKNGADPATHTLVLPEAYRAGIPYWLPSYVQFSILVTAPTLIRRLTVGPAIPPTF